jgi:hypothetical protein
MHWRSTHTATQREGGRDGRREDHHRCDDGWVVNATWMHNKNKFRNDLDNLE